MGIIMKYYEVSSIGDKRFSSFNAKFKSDTFLTIKICNKTEKIDCSNLSIEQVYQYKIKKSNKGKPPHKTSILYITDKKSKKYLENISYKYAYLPLWKLWAKQNKQLIRELQLITNKGYILKDSFAKTRVNQARALSDIINNLN